MSKYIPHDDCNPRTQAAISYLFIGVVVGMALISLVKCEREPMPEVVKHSSLDCKSCHNRTMSLAKYMKRRGSPEPEVMANALLKTRSPRLLAAISVVESNGNPKLRNTGYKHKYSGAFQTSQQWGIINKDTTATDQALMAELALETHVAEEGDIIKGLNAYGGESNKKRGKYAFNVLAELRDVP